MFMRSLLGLTLVFSLMFALRPGSVEGKSKPKVKREELSFYLSKKKIGIYSKRELEKGTFPKLVVVSDPYLQKEKRYRAIPLHTMLDLVYGKAWRKVSYTHVVFVDQDGYRQVVKSVLLEEKGAYVAIEDVDDRKWEGITPEGEGAGPFYLFWRGKDQSLANEYPWLRQLASIQFFKFEDQYPDVIPKYAKPGSSTYRGFEIFRDECIRCHAINRQGGKLGPDLNAPMNITEYRSSEMVKAMIKEPSKYRYTVMPDHPHLEEKDIDDLFKYLKAKKGKR